MKLAEPETKNRFMRARALRDATLGEPDDDDEDEGDNRMAPINDDALAKALDEEEQRVAAENAEAAYDREDVRLERMARVERIAIAMIRAGHGLGPGSVGLKPLVENAVFVATTIEQSVAE